jgi:hypothetical protein
VSAAPGISTSFNGALLVAQRLEADLTGDTLLGDWRHSDPSFIDSSYLT